MSIPTPRPASTVVLLRPAATGIEVFLVQRHGDIAFMGGAHVFPGGRVEADDCSEAYLPYADGLASATLRMAGEDGRAAGFHVAAVRETFEEAGVLLARDASEDMVSLDSVGAAVIAAQRQAIETGASSLLELVRAHDWRLALDALVYFAHWVTPAIETRRFDTRFFLAAAPPQQIASHNARETTDGLWVRPADAILRCTRGEIALPPPTWTTLRWLERFDTVDAALDWARRKSVPRIEPGFIESGESRIVLLPGDATMPAVPGFDARETRFLLSAGRWTPVPSGRS